MQLHSGIFQCFPFITGFKTAFKRSGNLRCRRRPAFIFNCFLNFFVNNTGERGRETCNSSEFKMYSLVWNHRCN